MIDMQRDFLEPGGFGETLGNDVSLLAQGDRAGGKALLAGARKHGMLVVHTREGHRPDLADAPPAKVERGAPSMRIGDPGPMGRILIRGEAGHDIIPALAPSAGEPVIDKPGKGAFYATDLHAILAQPRHREPDRRRRDDRGLRAHDRARGERSRLPLHRRRRLLRLVLPRVSRGGAADDQGPGRDLRLGVGLDAHPVRACMTLNREAQHDDRDMTRARKPKIWVPGDWNAFFGFGTNILVNLLVLTALLRFVLKMPDSLVFGRILPATGLMLCLSTLYYAWLAYRLAKKTGRTDVCALPSGISVPHMFIVTFVIMLPIAIKTGDPVKGWEAGLTWVFIQSFVLMAGGFIAPIIRKITPRAALLGTLAGVSIAFISMRPALGDVHDAGHRRGLLRDHPGELVRRRDATRGIPAGLVAIAVGIGHRLGLGGGGLDFGGMSLDKPVEARSRTSASRCRSRRSATCSPASSSWASSWSPRFRSASTTWSRRWTTSRARPSRATASRPRAC